MTNNQNKSDAQLMSAVKTGDMSCLGQLYQRYKKELYNFCLRRTRNVAASQDLVQQTFEKVMKYAHLFKEDQHFKAWIITIARNTHIDLLRSMKPTSDLKEYGAWTQERSEEDPLQLYKDQLGQALKKLNPKDREMIELAKMEQLRIKEIAEYYNMSESAVKVSIHRSMKKLRKLLIRNDD